jgi:molybdopterin synthase sulfur carrier subunit
VRDPSPVTVRLPTVLADMLGGRKRFEVFGATLGEVLDALVRQQPALGVHLFDDTGCVRRHILCFHAEHYGRGREHLDRPVKPGDTVTILNSVAGG